MGKRLSPFSVEFWVAKGYTEEEAIYQRNSRRPINWEYWARKEGLSFEEAKIKASETKKSNNKKGAKKSSLRSDYDKRKSSPRCIEYYLERGYTKEEGVSIIKERQALGRLDKFIERYGYHDGVKAWEERQIKWQQTLNSKTIEEIGTINKKKNNKRIDLFSSIEETVSVLNDNLNMSLVSSIEEFDMVIKEDLEENLYKRYMVPEVYFEKFVPNVQIEILKELGVDFSVYDELFNPRKFKVVGDGRNSIRLWTTKGLLRSSFEIYFYELYIDKFGGDDGLSIDKCYPESSFRYDFSFDDIYIEIAPMYISDEKYRKKMDKKVELFGCVLLKTKQEIEQFICNLRTKS